MLQQNLFIKNKAIDPLNMKFVTNLKHKDKGD